MIVPLKDNILELIPKEVLKSKGCYALILYTKNHPRLINRLCGIDNEGVLYIGKADVLRKRVKSLFESVYFNSNPSQNGHIEKGHNSLSAKYYRIRKNFNIEDLRIKIWARNDLDPKIFESFLLENYVSKYGELPPLNGIYGSVGYTVLDSNIDSL